MCIVYELSFSQSFKNRTGLTSRIGNSDQWSKLPIKGLDQESAEPVKKSIKFYLFIYGSTVRVLIMNLNLVEIIITQC